MLNSGRSRLGQLLDSWSDLHGVLQMGSNDLDQAAFSKPIPRPPLVGMIFRVLRNMAVADRLI